MKFSAAWLREFVDPAFGNEMLAHRLTMAGLEVEQHSVLAPPFEHVVVGHVLTVSPHENADRLKVCTVDVGQAIPLQIICGAPNVAVGVKVPCALVGAVLPGNMVIKKAKMRGIESHGMLCSATELGIDKTCEGLLILPPDAPVGQDFRQYYALDDQILTLKLTPNRADCLSVYGLARDIAAISQTPLNASTIDKVAVSLQAHMPIAITAKDACSRYCGRLIQRINAAALTPLWMRRRLERSGLRSVSAVVDITNYVMLELGQPLHAFNADAIEHGVTVRWARADERLVLLNEKEVQLTADMLIIADSKKPLALAGIMGGSNSAVTASTTNVFLESACFAPAAIAGRSRRLGFSSDAAHRYERGVDYALSVPAIERATALILEICGGVAGAVNEISTGAPIRNTVRVRLRRIATLLGVEITVDQVMTYLTALGMAPLHENGQFVVTIPSHRFDMTIEEDVIEEIGRLYGYDRIPVRAATTTLNMLPLPAQQVSSVDVKIKWAARGYHEVVNYAFVDVAWENDFAGNVSPVRLQNPIATQMSVLRSTLLGGLIDSLRKNVNRQHDRVRLFEVGRVFTRQDAAIAQPEKLAGLAYGPRYPEQWNHQRDPVDLYDVKGDIEAVFYPQSLRFVAVVHPALHPGRSAQIFYDDEAVGIVGELHPQWVQQYDLPSAPIVFELALSALTHRKIINTEPLSKQPFVRRDLALVVAETIPVQQILDTLRAVPSAVLQNVTLFDVYQGPGIAAGKRSLACKVILQGDQKTLTDQEIDAVIEQLVAAAAEKYGATLRI